MYTLIYFLKIFVLATTTLLLSACSSPTASESADRSGYTPKLHPAMHHVERSDGRIQIVTQLYDVDRIYKSMQGPWGQHEITILDSQEPELVWITGCHVEMVGPNGRQPMPEQFICHANLDLDVGHHNGVFGSNKRLDGRLFTLSQGQLDVEFPDGFGIPVMSDEPLNLVTQVLNLHLKDGAVQVRHKVTIEFVRDRHLKEPFHPLFESGVSGMVSLEDRELVYDADEPDAEESEHGRCVSCCLPGQKATEWDENEDQLGRKFTGHWIVKPGRQVNRTRVTTLMDLPFDTKVHHIAVHLHPFAESLELIDLTLGETVYKSFATNLKEQIGLSRVDYYSSAEGISLHQDHEYELVSVYNNTSQEDQDSMAVMYLYLLDHEFNKEQLPIASQRTPEFEQMVQGATR